MRKDVYALLERDPLPDDTDAVLEAAIASEDPLTCASGIDVFGRLVELRGHPSAKSLVEQVFAHTRHADHRVRAEAASTLALVGGDRRRDDSCRRLRDLLSDPHSRVRADASAALGDLKDMSASDLLAARLDDVDPQVGFEAAFALASLRDDRGLDTLTAALEEKRLRLDACEGLRRLHSLRSVPVLEALAARRLIPWVDRLTAFAVLASLETPGFAEKLLERTKARRFDERQYALALIGSHGIRSGVTRLIEVAEDRGNKLRETAVRALGELGEPAARPALELLLSAPDTPDALRTEATEALEKIK